MSKRLVKKFLATEEAKKIMLLSKDLGVNMMGVMTYMYEQWLKKRKTK